MSDSTLQKMNKPLGPIWILVLLLVVVGGYQLSVYSLGADEGSLETQEDEAARRAKNRRRESEKAQLTAAKQDAERQLDEFDNRVKACRKALEAKDYQKAQSELQQALQLKPSLELTQSQAVSYLTLSVEVAFFADGATAAQTAAEKARSSIGEWKKGGEVEPLEIVLAKAWIKVAGDQYFTGSKDLASVLSSQSITLLDDGKVPWEKQVLLADAPVYAAYKESKFNEALEYLAFREKVLADPNLESKKTLLEYARKRAPQNLFGEVYPFAPTQKGSESRTEIYLWDASGRSIQGGPEQLLSAPEFKIEAKPAEPNGVKINVWNGEEYVFLFEFSAGFRESFGPRLFERALGVKGSEASPRLVLYKQGTFERAQFIVHEIQWKSEAREELVRFSADFIASNTGEMNDLCFGRIRYKSTLR
ncbi:MAG: hypothetical protein KC800_10740 [Candidatus Eremiobacteraeota bacterium]|nr:hypothetical protein [Candidatus Eremiobacteraeota bacterium]